MHSRKIKSTDMSGLSRRVWIEPKHSVTAGLLKPYFHFSIRWRAMRKHADTFVPSTFEAVAVDSCGYKGLKTPQSLSHRLPAGFV